MWISAVKTLAVVGVALVDAVNILLLESIFSVARVESRTVSMKIATQSLFFLEGEAHAR